MTWTGCPSLLEGSGGACGLTATVIVTGRFQLVSSKMTVGAAPPLPAWKRLSPLELSTVWPSSSSVIVTGEVGARVSCSV